MIVLNQRAEDGEAVNQPLALPPKAPDSSAQVGFEVKYCEQLVIKPKPVRFETYKVGRKPNKAHIWALANYLATEDANVESLNAPYNVSRYQVD